MYTIFKIKNHKVLRDTHAHTLSYTIFGEYHNDNLLLVLCFCRLLCNKVCNVFTSIICRHIYICIDQIKTMVFKENNIFF